jgi:hypothetical protein
VRPGQTVAVAVLSRILLTLDLGAIQRVYYVQGSLFKTPWPPCNRPVVHNHLENTFLFLERSRRHCPPMTARSAGPEGSDGSPVTSAKWVGAPAPAKGLPVRRLSAKVKYVFRRRGFGHHGQGTVEYTALSKYPGPDWRERGGTSFLKVSRTLKPSSSPPRSGDSPTGIRHVSPQSGTSALGSGLFGGLEQSQARSQTSSPPLFKYLLCPVPDA